MGGQAKATVMIVDDETNILLFTEEILAEMGYRVLTASTAEEALHLVGETNTKIDLLLTDVMLPGMKGYELAKAIQKRQPEAKLLFMSAYMCPSLARKDNLDDDAYIQKPFTPESLTYAVKAIMGEA